MSEWVIESKSVVTNSYIKSFIHGRPYRIDIDIYMIVLTYERNTEPSSVKTPKQGEMLQNV